MNGAQLVEFGIKAVAHHATIAHQRGRLGQQRAGNQLHTLRRHVQRLHHGVEQGTGGQQGCQQRLHVPGFVQSQTQGHQLAGAHLTQGHACADALHIGRALEGFTQGLVDRAMLGVLQGRHRCQAVLGVAAVAFGLEQPALEFAAAHACHAGVEQREQGGAVFTPQGLGQLQVAAGGQGQINQRVIACHHHTVHVGQGTALCVLGIAQQRGHGCVGLAHVLGVPGVE